MWWLGLVACGVEDPGSPGTLPEPSETAEPPEPTVPASYPPTWDGMVVFFDHHCVRCHGAGLGQAPELPREASTVVAPLDPAGSVLWQVVSGVAVPAMPFDVGVLPEPDTRHVAEWILAGALSDGDADGAFSDVDCDDTDPASSLGSDWYPDVDRDGFGADAAIVACAQPPDTAAVDGDCDDGDAASFPGAPEACTDPADRDCDGAPGRIDADLDGFAACEECDDGDPAIAPSPAWYRDLDEDGAGDPADSVADCVAPAGYVALPDDCDDGNPSVGPAADERCNGIDDDCDLAVDEADAIDPAAWYPDADGDGYGSGAPVLACDPPADHAAFDGDCDDSDPAFAPDAVETCADPRDLNCDGATGLADGDGDGFGACDECDDGNPAISPSATEVCNGADDDCDGGIDVDAADEAVFFPDRDGDGFGDDTFPVVACDAPALHVAAGGDCDDGNPALHPDTAWYLDADLDGFGGGPPTSACLAPPGGVLADGDCDDADPASFPGAPEACTDPADRDCDGTAGFVDEDSDGLAACEECDDLDPAAGAATPWYPDADGDGFGDDLGEVFACDPPPGTVDVGADCDDTARFVNPDAALDPTDARDNDCDGALDEDGPLSHSADIQPLWNASCTAGCHSGMFPSGGLDLSSPAYNRIVGVASFDVPAMDRIAPGLPDDSYLWHKLLGTQFSVGGSGVRMPKNDPAWPADQLALVEAWIVGGALP